METLLTFLLVRGLIIAAVVLGIALLIAVVIVLARRAGRLDDAKRLAAPLARGLGNRKGVWGALGRGASGYLDDGKR